MVSQQANIHSECVFLGFSATISIQSLQLVGLVHVFNGVFDARVFCNKEDYGMIYDMI
jgi:hypothetical protein